jgi:CBS domain containing-hemolysin-like protein
MLKRLPFSLATVLTGNNIVIGNNIVNGLGTQFFSYCLLNHGVKDIELLVTLVIVPLFFLFGETLPKQYAYRHANALLLLAQPIHYWVKLLLYPCTYALNALIDATRAWLA